MIVDATPDHGQRRVALLAHRLRSDKIASIVPSSCDGGTTEVIISTKYYPSMPFSPREGLQGFYHAIEQDKVVPEWRGGNTTIQVFVRNG